MGSSFEAVGLEPWLTSVCKSLDVKHPTPVQAHCIPAILEGRNVVGSAETGSGKTAAFALPILQRLARDPFGIFALVLTPTRELAFQISDQFRALGSSVGIRDAVVVGGMDMAEQLAALSARPHVVIATPGRLADIMELNGRDVVDLRRLRFLVLDEADRLLQAEFDTQLSLVFRAANPKRQTLLFSATMTPTLERLQDLASGEYFRFNSRDNQFQTVSTLKQDYYLVPDRVKDCYLVYILKNLPDHASAVVFVSKCETCEILSRILTTVDIPATALHSQMKQEHRLQRLQQFRTGAHRALIATDLASRGLDIPRVDLVVNYDLPRVASVYVHRVGRTARAGRGGVAVSLVTQYDVELVHNIEDRIGKRLEEADHSEKEVLEYLTQVLKARKAARLEVMDSGFLERVARRRKRKREQRSGK